MIVDHQHMLEIGVTRLSTCAASQVICARPVGSSHTVEKRHLFFDNTVLPPVALNSSPYRNPIIAYSIKALWITLAGAFLILHNIHSFIRLPTSSRNGGFTRQELTITRIIKRWRAYV